MKKKTAPTPYDQTQEFQTLLGQPLDEPIRFLSKPGLPQWNEVTPSIRLLAETVALLHQGRCLLLGSGHGALGVALARRAFPAEIWLADPNLIALDMTEQTLRLNHIENARILSEISVLPEHTGSFDVVVIDLPKGRKLSRRWLVEAYHALRLGGKLYLAGANGQGVQSVAADAAALFGNSAVLAYKKGNRVVQFIKDEHNEASPPAPDWVHEPGIAPGTWVEFDAQTPAGPLHLLSLPGIFSTGELDEGTRLLLEHLSVPEGASVLDLGCGSGVIGITAALQGAGSVDLVDVSLLAVAAARANLALHGIQNGRALPSDALNAVLDRRYQLILTNPPFHTGTGVDYSATHAFITQARQVLEPRGRLVLVANKFIRYDQVLGEVFGRVHTIAETGKFYVLSATH